MSRRKRRICYVTGTRAEFGLMTSTLREIRDHRGLELQLVVTGVHLSRAHGRTIDAIRAAGWRVDASVPWQGSLAEATGSAMAGMSRVIERLDPDVVLICGDRVEAFAAASAGHLSGRVVAHVHGGDRALGLVDDSLRHAISKLSHVHFCATKPSRERLFAMGEDGWRIRCVGTPGIDGVRELARSQRGIEPIDALVLLHPDSTDDDEQFARARLLLDAVATTCDGRAVALYPNNDPGWRGIARALEQERRIEVVREWPRERFLGQLMRSRVLVGNSSSGIIEAASLGVRVVNVGDRQKGRERSANVIDVRWDAGAIGRAVRRASGSGYAGHNVYAGVYRGGSAGNRIARALSDLGIDRRLMGKLIRY
jgi:GDP/UDP-N,N'-diacetylbacillosamine 2-epimerase (hydrolysing)